MGLIALTKIFLYPAFFFVDLGYTKHTHILPEMSCVEEYIKHPKSILTAGRKGYG